MITMLLKISSMAMLLMLSSASPSEPYPRDAIQLLEENKAMKLLRNPILHFQEPTSRDVDGKITFSDVAKVERPPETLGTPPIISDERYLSETASSWFQRSDFNNSINCMSETVLMSSFGLDICIPYSYKNESVRYNASVSGTTMLITQSVFPIKNCQGIPKMRNDKFSTTCAASPNGISEE